MPETVIVTRLPADATQQATLQSVFSSPGFSLLKEMVAARCIVAQVEAMNARLYPRNEAAEATATENERRAAEYNRCLDILDDISQKEDDWFTVKLEHRR